MQFLLYLKFQSFQIYYTGNLNDLLFLLLESTDLKLVINDLQILLMFPQNLLLCSKNILALSDIDVILCKHRKT